MVSTKAIAAIALTLIIAVPIGLGYGLASTEETVTNWETSSSTNVTDLLLNSETEYTATFNDPRNNKELLYSSGGSAGYIAPDYVSTGSTYSSLPKYVTMSNIVNLEQPTTTYASADTSIGSSGSGADIALTCQAVYFDNLTATTDSNAGLAFHNGDGGLLITLVVDSESTAWIYHNITANQWVLEMFDGVTTHTYYATEWSTNMNALISVDVTTYEYTQIDPGNVDIAFTMQYYSALKIVTDSSTYEHYYVYGQYSTTVTLTASGEFEARVDRGNGWTSVLPHSGVTAIYVAGSPNLSSITYTYTAADPDEYADAAAGWRLLDQHDVWWGNGHDNQYVRMMLYFRGNSSVTLAPKDSMSTAGSSAIQVAYTDNGLEVTDPQTSTTTLLGQYRYVMVEFSLYEATVYGLNTWPTLGVFPETYNSVTVDYGYEILADTFSYIYIQDDGSGNIRYRVDMAEIIAGTYPITKNYSLRPYIYYPDQSIIYTIKSVAVYGTSLNPVNRDTSLGTVFAVTDGTITIDGDVVKLRGMQIKFLKDSDGKWDVYYNDHLIYENLTNGAYVYMGGVWSLTMSAATVTETTSTQTVWQPDEFVLDTNGFVVAMAITAAGAFVVLGMTGARSGAKIALLALVCGGTVLAAMTLL